MQRIVSSCAVVLVRGCALLYLPVKGVFCACRDDRLAWVSALAGQKLQLSGKGATYNDQSAAITRPLVGGNGQVAPPVAAAAKLLEDLKKKDAMGDPSCQRILVALQKEMRGVDATMHEKDRQIQQLMEERRQLQTELVTESQRLDHLVCIAASPAVQAPLSASRVANAGIASFCCSYCALNTS